MEPKIFELYNPYFVSISELSESAAVGTLNNVKGIKEPRDQKILRNKENI